MPRPISITLKQKEFIMLKNLRRAHHELGGSIEFYEPGKKVKQVKIVNGTRTYVTVDAIPIGELSFHTHPEIPFIKGTKDPISAALGYHEKNKKKDFPVNIVVQPVSDDDLTAMTTSLVENRNCVMMVICPEGIYTLFRTHDHGSFDHLKKEYKKEKKWISAASKYLISRDEMILDYFDDHVMPKLKKEKTVNGKRKLLENFQKKTGSFTIKLIRKHFPLLGVKFYTWNAKEIKLKNLQCKVCPRVNGRKVCK